jgi:hypothetical protein
LAIPSFFVNAASKGFRFFVSLLDATLARKLVNIASKGFKFT